MKLDIRHLYTTWPLLTNKPSRGRGLAHKCNDIHIGTKLGTNVPNTVNTNSRSSTWWRYITAKMFKVVNFIENDQKYIEGFCMVCLMWTSDIWQVWPGVQK